mgnify:CR=1 FL=1
MKNVLNDFARHGSLGDEYINEILGKGRQMIAKLIKNDPKNITFTSNTSQGILIALLNIPFKEGDEVLVMEECFPAAKYVAEYNLPGINTRYVKLKMKDPVEVAKKEIKDKTKAVILDYVQYFTGERLPIKELSRFLRERDIFLIIDGIQALGSIYLDVKKEDIDILACGGSKWLNGPQGTGFLYVSPWAFGKMKKVHTGWLGAPWKNFQNFTNLPQPFNDARRFETGTRNIVGISGLTESIEILFEYGIKNVEEKIQKLNTLIFRGLMDKGYEILTPKNRMAGIVTGRPKRGLAEKVYKKITDKNIVISLRNNALRFSPHFYNSVDEIEKVIEII